MKLQPHERLLVVGITGAGKSSYVQKIVKDAPRVVVWDYHGEYKELEQVTVDEFSAKIENENDNLRVAVKPEAKDLDDVSSEFVAFADLLPYSENHLTVIDEVGLLRGKAAGRLDYIATQSRHWSQPLVLVAQRATQIPKTAREQASKIVSFRQTSPDDVAALVDRIGEKAQRIKSLPRFQLVQWCADEEFEQPRPAPKKSAGKKRS